MCKVDMTNKNKLHDIETFKIIHFDLLKNLSPCTPAIVAVMERTVTA